MKLIKIFLSVCFVWTALICTAQSNLIGQPRQRLIIFEGNSLSAFGSNSASLNGYYVPVGVYNNVRSSSVILAYTSLAISGRNQTQINAAISTNITPFVKKNDLIVLWEGTNDMYTNALSGQAAYDNLATYVNTVKGYGAIVVVCTVIARDYSLDAADLMTRIGDYNTLVRNNASSLGITLCDLAADPLFDTRSDCSNTTYYNADKIHQATAGQDRVITLMTTAVNTAIAKSDIVPDYSDGVYILIIGGIVYYLNRKKKEPEYRMAA